MRQKSTWAALLSGVLVANSAPHLASAVAGRRHLTPLAGRDSSPAVNGAWGAANLAGGLLLLRRAAGAPSPSRWDERLPWFEAGAAAFSVWMAGSEIVLRVNTPRAVDTGHPRSSRG
ncbi:hypothetical protein SAMN05216184_11562 [Georgenia satyanarayanai]|uniref:Uncharacterized protein n=1 Tax=Georgenia satyanarayanai TaxID=860221 RepID=A0A2Y9ANM5_9MICO|nr:hypothetical protein [Georgenia satyanarayanai]PYF97353.1 hypothetical protein A8987_11562 [Georgenia satyanarayanai]SSA46134.1 hypothetical protein SAMN05216184_11562 [Georgenia satyanarayanai]